MRNSGIRHQKIGRRAIYKIKTDVGTVANRVNKSGLLTNRC
jgi:hypothetical protein